MSKERFKVTPAVYLALTDQDNVLLVKRGDTPFESGKYCLVAGHIENNETPFQAMIREAKEEVGIDISPEDLQIAHIMYRQRAFEDGVPYVDFFLLCDKWQGEIQNLEPHKTTELRWTPMNELPPEIIPYIRQALECIERKELYSEYGW